MRRISWLAVSTVMPNMRSVSTPMATTAQLALDLARPCVAEGRAEGLARGVCRLLDAMGVCPLVEVPPASAEGSGLRPAGGGRPRLRRRFGFAAFGFGAGFSRASRVGARRQRPLHHRRDQERARRFSRRCQVGGLPQPLRSGQARSRASGTTPVERRTSNPIASRAGTRLHSSVVIMRCFATAHDTHEGGPVPPQGPSLRQKSRSPQLFCKRLL